MSVLVWPIVMNISTQQSKLFLLHFIKRQISYKYAETPPPPSQKVYTILALLPCLMLILKEFSSILILWLSRICLLIFSLTLTLVCVQNLSAHS